ncbi:MAG: PH domain-containing protein [Thermomicrobiales bacterium]|jgi:putative membrane protein
MSDISSQSTSPGDARTLAHPQTEDAGRPNLTDETTWRRMSIRFIFTGTVRQLRSLLLPAVILLFAGGGDTNRQLVYLGIGVVFAIMSAGFNLLEWQFFRYAFTDRELVVRSGVFQKQERAVPFERIQAINIEEAPLERLVGIARVKVETAAGGAADVKIDAIERASAYRLREDLSAARARVRGDEPEGAGSSTATASHDGTAAVSASTLASEGELLRKLSTPELLALGATSGRIGPAAAVAGALLQFGTDLFPESWWKRLPIERAETLTNVNIAITLLFIAAFLAWILAIVSTALAFGGFELRRSGDQLLVQHGLLDRRRTTIPVQRIQAVVVGEQLLRQPFHYADVRFESAGGGGGEAGAQAGSGVLFPFLPLRDVQGLLDQAAPDFATDPETAMATRLPGRALRRYIISATLDWVLFVGMAMAVLGFWAHRWIEQVSWQQVGLMLLVTPVFAWLGWARWRDGGWTMNARMLLLRWRGLSRQTMITRVERIQHRTIMSGPLQRRADLTTIRVSVASGLAGGHYSLPHADEQEAERLIAQLGGPHHEIEIRKVPVAEQQVDGPNVSQELASS